MSATPRTPRLARLAIFAITATAALLVAACGTSNNENSGKPGTSTSLTATSTSSATQPPPAPPAPPAGKDHVEGLVRSVSGNAVQLTQRDRTAATVDFTPQTLVTEVSSAALTDVTPGSCIEVKASPASNPPGEALTAQSVEISPAEGHGCPPPEEPGAGSPGSAPPAPSPGEPGERPGVYGTVGAVTGNTIAVSGTDPTGKTTNTNVTVIDTTTYVKHAVTNTQAVQQGKCIAAQGTMSGGVLQAATIDLEPCPPMGREHHHHLPHLHHHR